jgi:hypothetical protein
VIILPRKQLEHLQCALRRAVDARLDAEKEAALARATMHDDERRWREVLESLLPERVPRLLIAAEHVAEADAKGDVKEMSEAGAYALAGLRFAVGQLRREATPAAPG